MFLRTPEVAQIMMVLMGEGIHVKELSVTFVEDDGVDVEGKLGKITNELRMV